jgi:DNA-binding MarR family transcriptional regulator
MPQHDDDAARLAVAVGRINRLIRPSGENLTLGLLSALSTILRKGPVRPSDLVRIESAAAPTVTRLLADLESRGLIRRTADPSDRRSFTVEVTDAGAAAVLAARVERADAVSVLLDRLSEEERATIDAALSALERIAEPG